MTLLSTTQLGPRTGCSNHVLLNEYLSKSPEILKYLFLFQKGSGSRNREDPD